MQTSRIRRSIDSKENKVISVAVETGMYKPEIPDHLSIPQIVNTNMTMRAATSFVTRPSVTTATFPLILNPPSYSAIDSASGRMSKKIWQICKPI